MVGVRNGPLVQLLVAQAGETSLGVVPAGLTWLLKSVYLANAAAVDQQVVLMLRDATTTVIARLLDRQLTVGQALEWTGWVALAPGDRLVVTCGGTLHVWASGAELPGTR